MVIMSYFYAIPIDFFIKGRDCLISPFLMKILIKSSYIYWSLISILFNKDFKESVFISKLFSYDLFIM